MCGICGLAGTANVRVIEAMTKILAHRGPDDSGIEIFAEGRAALGHTRLSILDLSPRGHQPMPDASRRLWITYNGEIYNYREIRRELMAKGHRFTTETDTEVALCAYQQWGDDFLKRLNGMFALAIWDSKRKRVFLARDRLGVKPLYYFCRNGVLVFASEIKSILASGLAPRQIDYSALHTPAMHQVSPLTGFRDIYKLQPASSLAFDGERIEVQRYWQISPQETNINEDQAANELDHLLNLSVRGQMISDRPVGAFLSGGLDSSLIVALMSKNATEKISTFTIKYAEEDRRFEQTPDDGKFAGKAASLFQCQHHELTIRPDMVELLPRVLWHLDEPLADPAAINTYLIAKTAKENGIVVLLNGMGGDEIFGGYRHQLACLWADLYQAYVPAFAQELIKKIVRHVPAATRQRGLRRARWVKRFVSFGSLPSVSRYFASRTFGPEEFAGLFTPAQCNGRDYWMTHFVRSQIQTLERDDISYLTRICLNDTQVFLPDHNLTYIDKCTMAAGVESRPPFTDHRLVEFMFSVPPRLRINGTSQKYLLKKVAAGYLPRDLVHRRKAPFGAPLRSWIRGPLAEMIGDYLSPGSLQRRDIYNPQTVWRKIQNDRKGTEDNAHLIWTLLCNEIWLRTFFD
ncbi:MAG: asparagine synthase (glutamine-hydrolyzing) [bacterium]